MANTVKATLRGGNGAFGTMISAVTWPGLMDILAADGWQFVVIDTEHSRIGPEALESLIRAGSQAGLAIEADGLPAEALEGIAAELSLHTGETPSVAVHATDESIQLLFAVVQEGS